MPPDPLLARVQRAVAGRYAVLQELGRGGMAVVYLGNDLRHPRRVAIKVFEKDGELIAGAERFLREIQIAARLQHPNILPVFDSGESDDLVFYVMPCVAGGSVRERLEREGPLPLGDVLRIGREVAEALDHAHRAGVIHRDIKPDNIMLMDGVAVVADFGIARALEEGGVKVTDTGLAIGTPTYMSPEQATAHPHLDGRTDIYGLGCVMYEMLVGTPPFVAANGQALMARHATDAVPPMRTTRDIPAQLEAVVLKALAKTPADRWPTGRAMAEGLASVGIGTSANAEISSRHSRWPAIAAGIALIAVAALTVTLLQRREAPATVASGTRSAIPSVGVLPLSLIGDTSLAYIADGFTEAIITALARVEGVHVPGQSTVTRYAGRGLDPVVIGRELQVENVLTGNVEVSGSSLRVRPKLVRVSDGLLRWSDNYDGEMANRFSMQDRITRQIIDTLRVQLTPTAQLALARGVGTRNYEAYSLYMLGRSMYARADIASLRKAVDYLKRAAEKDTAYAAPLLALADVYDLMENVEPGAYRVSGLDRTQLIRRAYQLNPQDGDALMHMAGLRSLACDDDGAARDMREAVRLSPGSSELRRNYVEYLLGAGRFQDAVVEGTAAATIDPTSPWVLAVLSYAYSLAGQHDSALAVSERALTIDSTQWVPHAVHGTVLALAGRYADAIEELEMSRRLGGAFHGLTTGVLGWTYARAGRRADALRIADTLAIREQRGQAGRWQVAYVYAALGEREKAFAWLAKAPRSTDWKHSDAWSRQPMLDALRSDPRFDALAKKRYCAPGA